MRNRSLTVIAASAATLLLAACGSQEGTAPAAAGSDAPADKVDAIRKEVRIVGSSTVYPFSSFVAEALGAAGKFSSPIVESTGSGGGMKLFCAGLGANHPDITNASRRMKASELELCKSNGVTDITEVKVGFDGIVLANKKGATPINLTKRQILLAVAAEVPVGGQLVPNPYKRWNEIDGSLPAQDIIIYGPPTSSGTRDAFEDMILKGQTKKMAEYGNKKYKKIRDDGLYVASGENDNLIVKKLEKNPIALGIFGYSFLEENKDKVQAALIDGVSPKPDTISSGKYPISRSLFYYIKNEHEAKVPGMTQYVRLFGSEKMIGPEGELGEIGLIALPDAERTAVRAAVKARTKLTAEALAKH